MFEFEVVEDHVVLKSVVFLPIDITVEVETVGRVEGESPFGLSPLSGGNEK